MNSAALNRSSFWLVPAMGRSGDDSGVAWSIGSQMDLTRQRLCAAMAIPAGRVMAGCTPRIRIAGCNNRLGGLLRSGRLLLRRILTELYLPLGKSP